MFAALLVVCTVPLNVMLLSQVIGILQILWMDASVIEDRAAKALFSGDSFIIH